MGTDTRRTMVDTAVRLFRTQGYAATSWRGLVKEAGTPWGSVQHHFPGGKAELGVAAVAVGEDLVLQAIAIGFERFPDPGDAVAWWIGRAGRILEKSGYEQGCPVIMLGLETGDPAVAAAARSTFERWLAALADRLASRGVPDPEAAALSVLTTVEGALLLAKTLRSAAPLEQAALDVRRRLA